MKNMTFQAWNYIHNTMGELTQIYETICNRTVCVCVLFCSMEICHPRNNITMCPQCDRVCSYWKLSTACGTARASHLFDNPATVFFSIFMALWGERRHVHSQNYFPPYEIYTAIALDSNAEVEFQWFRKKPLFLEKQWFELDSVHVKMSLSHSPSYSNYADLCL